MASSSYLVDHELRAIPMDRLLEVRESLRDRGNMASPAPTAAADRPLLGQGATLETGKLYPAERTPNRRYYLPAYTIATDPAGKPRVLLRYEPSGSPGYGTLSIDLTWAPLSAPGLEVRVLDHLVQLSLHYVAEVGGGVGGAGLASAVPLEPLRSVDERTWRSETVLATKELFDVVYQAMQSKTREAKLRLDYNATVGLKTWRQVVVGRPPRDPFDPRVSLGRGVVTDVIEPETAVRLPPGGLRHVETVRPVGDVTERARERVELRRHLAAERMEERADATRRAPVARIGRMAAVERATPAVAHAGPAGAPAIARIPMVERLVRAERLVGHFPIAPGGGDETLPRPPPPDDVLVAPPLEAPPAGPPVRARMTAAATRTALARSYAPPLREAVETSDIVIGDRKVIPIRVAVDELGMPAIITTPMRVTRELPFVFDPRDHGAVYVAGGYAEGVPHLLLPMHLPDASATNLRAFQDNLMRDVVHLVPTEYRVGRSSLPPYDPEMSLVASDFGAPAGEQAADVLYRMTFVYRLEPWIDPAVFRLVHGELAKQGLVPRFTMVRPQDPTLDLEIGGQRQSRPGVKADDDASIRDALELDLDQFQQLWKQLSVAGGIGGTVKFTLFDGTPWTAPVHIAFAQEATDVLDVVFDGPTDTPGDYRLKVINRIECPVALRAPAPLILGPSQVAQPLSPSNYLDKLLRPRESCELVYRVSPPETPVVELLPTVSGVVRPDGSGLAALLKLLLVTQGFASLSFAVEVSAAPGVFAPAPPGQASLTGLRVEFHDGTQLDLTGTESSARASLVSRLAQHLLGNESEQQGYLYRVTNLHPAGEGARTAWAEAFAGQPLVVGAAAVQLDF